MNKFIYKLNLLYKNVSIEYLGKLAICTNTKQCRPLHIYDIDLQELIATTDERDTVLLSSMRHDNQYAVISEPSHFFTYDVINKTQHRIPQVTQDWTAQYRLLSVPGTFRISEIASDAQGIIDIAGNIIIKPEYMSIHTGLNDIFIGRKEGIIHYIDKFGNILRKSELNCALTIAQLPEVQLYKERNPDNTGVIMNRDLKIIKTLYPDGRSIKVEAGMFIIKDSANNTLFMDSEGNFQYDTNFFNSIENVNQTNSLGAKKLYRKGKSYIASTGISMYSITENKAKSLITDDRW